MGKAVGKMQVIEDDLSSSELGTVNKRQVKKIKGRYNSQGTQTSKSSSSKILLGGVPSISTEDLQCGNKRRNEPLLKAAGPIIPDELQVREEVFQAWRTEKTQQKNH